MAHALEIRAHKDDVLIGDTPKAIKRRARVDRLRDQAAGRLWKHATLADIDGIVSTRDLAGMFCFTLVRNPWDRVVSYYHWLRDQSFNHPAVHLAKAESFAGFVSDIQTQVGLSEWHYGRYMCDALGQERGQFLRLEHLEQDMQPLCAHLGFTPEVPHENRSDRGAYRDYYDAPLRDLVGRICARDIARFGYEF
jgi:hypothetical protein